MGSERRVAARYLIDTDVFIDHLNGVAKAMAWLSSLEEGEAMVSVVTRAEVLAGTEDASKRRVVRVLDDYGCLAVTTSVADRAAELRRQHRWKLPDAFQAALAVENGLRLVTRNTKDFAEDKHSFVLVPYEL